MEKSISALLVLVMMLALLSGCGDNSGGVNVDTSDLYKQVMARFDGKLEEGAVIKVLPLPDPGYRRGRSLPDGSGAGDFLPAQGLPIRRSL